MHKIGYSIDILDIFIQINIVAPGNSREFAILDFIDIIHILHLPWYNILLDYTNILVPYIYIIYRLYTL